MRPANVSAGQAKEYYYQKDPVHGEQKLELKGEGAERLGIAGEISKEQFEKLLEGRDPSGKDKWEVKGAGPDRERAGVDTPISAPKSVSIQAYHSNDPKQRQDMQDSMKAAGEKFAVYMQKENYFQYRETVNGETTAKTGQGMYTFFQHSESRSGDPHAHTHMVIYNSVVTQNGDVRALSADNIFAEQRSLTVAFNGFLAKELTNKGYALETKANGTFELAGHNPKQVEQFSKRAETIDEKTKELQEKYPNAKHEQMQELAQKSSRAAKDTLHTAEDSKKNWTEQDKISGIDQSKTDQNVKEAEIKAKEFSGEHGKTPDYIGKAVLSLHERESTFSKADAIKTAGIFAMGEKSADELSKSFDARVKDKNIINLGSDERSQGQAKHNVDVYASKGMIKIEKEIIQAARAGAGKAEPIMSKEAAQKALTEWQDKNNKILTADQHKAAEHILTSTDKVVLVFGDAGTGKTTMLRAVNDISKEHGYQTQGLSNTGKASGELERSSGIKSETAARFIDSDEKNISGKSMTVIDETSMMGSAKTHEVLKATLQENNPNSKVVMIGDTKQLQSISAGKTFHDLQEKSGLKTVEMKENVRQTDPGAKLIAGHMSEKEFEKAFTEMGKQGRIIEIANKDERHAAIVKDYIKDAVAGKDQILTTATNADRQDLNNRIHTQLLAAEKIGVAEYNGKIEKGVEFTFLTRESKNLDPIQKQFAGSYDKGDILIKNTEAKGLAPTENLNINKIMGDINKGAELKITELNHQTHTAKVVDKMGTERTVDLQKHGDQFAVYKEQPQKFSPGEKIIFNKNDKGEQGIGVSNGDTGTIKAINQVIGKLVVQHETGKQVSFYVNNYNYISPGHAVTKEKSQGMTVKNEGRANVDTEKIHLPMRPMLK